MALYALLSSSCRELCEPFVLPAVAFGHHHCQSLKKNLFWGPFYYKTFFLSFFFWPYICFLPCSHKYGHSVCVHAQILLSLFYDMRCTQLFCFEGHLIRPFLNSINGHVHTQAAIAHSFIHQFGYSDVS